MKLKMLSLVMAMLMLLLCACNAVQDTVETTEDTETTIELMETETEIETEEELVIVDGVKYPFVMDENVLGRWITCGFVGTIDDYPYNTYNVDYWIKEITFFDDSSTSYLIEGEFYDFLTWTSGIIMSTQDFINSKYIIKDIDGLDYLFYEWKNEAGQKDTPYYVFIKDRGGRYSLTKFSDIRVGVNATMYSIFDEREYNINDLVTYSYQSDTVFYGAEDYAVEVLEKGKDPGLGIRDLHEQGITGKGVNVAIIDQNLVTTQYHPEYDGKIVEYYDTGTGQNENSGSMHGPGVLSILVGETVGVAPDSKVYYAAAPSWKADSQYYADALYWIIEENKKLPDDEKIRVVSISAAPSGSGSPFNDNQESYDEAVEAAHAEGILIMDCRDDYHTGFIYPMYGEIDNKDDFRTYTTGFPSRLPFTHLTGVFAPTSLRTTAGQYSPDDIHYTYWGSGGLSWGIPYAAGVLALGWQINPNLTKDEIVQILFDTCYVNSDGAHIINPPAFIEYIQNNANR